MPKKLPPANYVFKLKDLLLMSASLKVGLKINPGVYQHVWYVVENGRKLRRTKQILCIDVTYKNQIIQLTKKLENHQLTLAVVEAYREYYVKVYKYKSIYTMRYVRIYV